MLIIREAKEMQEWSNQHHGDTIALVPTMGYLHNGHLSLVAEAKKRAARVVVSIYVNPRQFAPGEDLNIYPRDFEGDLAKLKPYGVDVVFSPADLYDSDHQTWVRVEGLEKHLCGKSRPTFFRGVATVVTKLINIVRPNVMLFGKKDYQQWRVISCMVKQLFFPVEIVGCPLVREQDGLALSSRNVRLSPSERQQALSIFKSLKQAEMAVRGGETDCNLLISQAVDLITSSEGKVDYAQIVDHETLEPLSEVKKPCVFAIAAAFGNVRLIDNIVFED